MPDDPLWAGLSYRLVGRQAPAVCFQHVTTSVPTRCTPFEREQPPDSHVIMATTTCPYLCFEDHLSDYHIVIDTGCPRSLWPAAGAQVYDVHRCGCFLGSDTGLIRTYGTHVRHIRLSGSAAPHRVVFLLADVAVPMLGADFLRDSGLRVNSRARTLTLTDPPVGYIALTIYGLPEHAPHAGPFCADAPRCVHVPGSCVCAHEEADALP